MAKFCDECMDVFLCMFSSYYLDHNIWVNIFTVDSKWLYSLYWCMNVSSVTTNMCHEFAQMSSPVWHMVWRLYVQALLHHFMYFCSALLQLFLVELFFVLFVLLVYHWVCKPACLVHAQARINREGCRRNVIRRKNGGMMKVGHWLVWMEWRPVRLLVCLLLLSSLAP